MMNNTLFFVDKKAFGLKKANSLALHALRASKYYALERCTVVYKWVCGTDLSLKHKYYWIYEFYGDLPIQMPNYKIYRDGNYCDGTKSNFGKEMK